MTVEFLSLVGFAVVIGLLLLRTPIGVALGLVGCVGLAIVISPEAAFIKAGVVAFTTVSKYELGVLPLFLLMANILFAAGVSSRFFDAAAALVGHRRGGLAMASVTGCAGFAAVSGSSLATSATMGLVALPEMRKANYAPTLSTGALAAGGTLGALIPPSGALIVFGVIAEQSIGKLFMAGLIPGLTQALLYLGVIYFLCRRKPELGPRLPRMPWRDRIGPLKGVADTLVLVVFVFTGITVGWFSPTEAAAIGAIGSIVIAGTRGKLSTQMMKTALSATLKTSGMLYLVIIGALIFGTFVSATGFETLVASFADSAPFGKWGVIIFMAIVLLGLGMFLDGMGIMLLATPVFLPLIESYGLSPIWFGIFVVRTIEMGFLTPPVGMNAYVIQNIAPDIPIGTVFKGIIPFFIADAFHLVLLIAFPIIALAIPTMVGS